YGPWLVSNYEIHEGMKVLELGCGTGTLWLGHDDLIEKCDKLVLSDLSEGMLEKAKENLGVKGNVEYRIEDIQELSFDDDTFDVIIANAMLYHVPDLNKGLKEVRRVLKKGGVFYCSTLGENNFVDRLAEWFKLSGEEFNPNHNFTMQNGTEKLNVAFDDVTPLFYEDSLHITEIEDLVMYLRSLSTFKTFLDLPEQKIRDILLEHEVGGAVDLPKDYGMFICR
ncbi:MAG: class I SAM-dependent methyltransferase, partial [Lachnospiraceae bacterium]|nr:class I SAM-dependent methyltransferase [Lachnospiraceae bacterium]